MEFLSYLITGIITAMSLQSAVPNDLVRMVIALAAKKAPATSGCSAPIP